MAWVGFAGIVGFPRVFRSPMHDNHSLGFVGIVGIVGLSVGLRTVSDDMGRNRRNCWNSCLFRSHRHGRYILICIEIVGIVGIYGVLCPVYDGMGRNCRNCLNYPSVSLTHARQPYIEIC